MSETFVCFLGDLTLTCSKAAESETEKAADDPRPAPTGISDFISTDIDGSLLLLKKKSQN